MGASLGPALPRIQGDSCLGSRHDIGLQTDDAEAFYTSLGYRHQPAFMSVIVGEWLVNQANQA